MTHAWKQTIHIDETLAKKLIETQHAIEVHEIKILDQGWDNVAFLINHDLIFRFPRRDIALQCMENECTILPFIAEHVDFPMTAPQWIGHPSNDYPYPFMGYQMLVGKSLTDATNNYIDDKLFAENLAKWLKQLHLIKVRPSDRDHYKDFIDIKFNLAHRVKRSHENIAQYEHFYHEAGFDTKTLLECIEIMKGFDLGSNPKVYIHGDLYHRHIIVNPTNLSPVGLIDWGDICLSHPAIDLAVGMIFTPDVFEHFLQSYGDIDHHIRSTLSMHAFAHSMSFLPYAFEVNKHPLKHWAVLVFKRAIQEISKCR